MAKEKGNPPEAAPAAPAASLASEVAATDGPIVAEPAGVEPPAIGVSERKTPTLEETGGRDPVMAELLTRLKAMQEEIARFKGTPTPERPADFREFVAAPTLKEPKKFRVALPHAPTGVVAIETAGVREIDWKDRAIAEYNRCMGITTTVHAYEVSEA